MKGRDCILVNRMYTGTYLQKSNIGHEAINTFLADNGNHYIYVNPYGTFSKVHEDFISKVLLVRSISRSMIEVIGVAEGLESFLSDDGFNMHGSDKEKYKQAELDNQVQRIDREGISYGGILLYALYQGQDNTTYITYKVKRYRSVKKDKPIYLVDHREEVEADPEKGIWLVPEVNFPSTAMHALYYSDVNAKAYAKLEELIENPDLWTDDDPSKKIDINKKRNTPMNIMKIIGKEYGELQFSNWLAFYLEGYDSFCKAFIREVLNLDVSETEISVKVEREFRNIDIFMITAQHVIVIENKILSGINGRKNPPVYDEQDKFEISQLSKYYGIAEEYKGKDRDVCCFLLVPDYSDIPETLSRFSKGDDYKVIRYSTLAKFLKSIQFDMPLLDQFQLALVKHTGKYPEDLQGDMEDKLIDRIRMKRGCPERLSTID